MLHKPPLFGIFQDLKEREKARAIEMLELTHGDDSHDALKRLLAEKQQGLLLGLVPETMTVTEYAAMTVYTDVEDDVSYMHRRAQECHNCPSHGGECDQETGPKDRFGKVLAYDGSQNCLVWNNCDRWEPYLRWKYMGVMGVPTKFRGCNLENFHSSTASHERALEIAKTYLGRPDDSHQETSYRASGGCLGMYIYGPAEVGKTHLACAIMRGVLTKPGVRFVRFFNTEDLVERMSKERSIEARDALRSKCTEASVLVLDDLTPDMDDAGAKFIRSLVIDRVDNDRPMIITSRVPPELLQTRFTDRVYNRIRRGCMMLPIGVDEEDQ